MKTARCIFTDGRVGAEKRKMIFALSGYYSATQFSSLMNINVSHIYQDLGMEGGKEFLLYQRRVAFGLFHAFLKICDRGQCNGGKPCAKFLAASSGNTYLYENKYSLPLGFMVDDEVAERWDYKNGGGVLTRMSCRIVEGTGRDALSSSSGIGSRRVYDSGDGGRILFYKIQFCDIRHP